MSGVNDIGVALSALELRKLFCELCPDSRFALEDQLGAWRHVILSGQQTFTGAGTVDLISYTVPPRNSLVILHTSIGMQPVSVGDEGLGETPFNYGDFFNLHSINPYGDTDLTAVAITAQWLSNNSGISPTPVTHSNAIQGQQVLMVVDSGNQIILRINPRLAVGLMTASYFATAWCFFVPPQVGGVLNSLRTQFEPASSNGVNP